MRIIDKNVTGREMDDLAQEFFLSVCPINTSNSRYNAKYFAGKLERLAEATNKKRKYYPIYKYLFDNLELLIKGTPDELKEFNISFEEYLSKNNILDYLEKRNCKKQLRKIFHGAYNNFRYGGWEGLRNQWFMNLNIQTCPYCNRHWTSKVMNQENNGYRLFFDVDHYFPKGKYPWLAISYYNLIPSCTICNQRIKHREELNLKLHIHPFRDDMHKYIKFNVPIESSGDFFDKDVDVKLEMIARKPYKDSDDMVVKSLETFRFFNLDNFYNTHLDYVRELMQRELVYSKDYVESLLNMETDKGNAVFENERDLLKMIVGNYVLPEHIHKRPLAKLTQDILDDFTNRHL